MQFKLKRTISRTKAWKTNLWLIFIQLYGSSISNYGEDVKKIPFITIILFHTGYCSKKINGTLPYKWNVCVMQSKWNVGYCDICRIYDHRRDNLFYICTDYLHHAYPHISLFMFGILTFMFFKFVVEFKKKFLFGSNFSYFLN